MRNLLLLLAVAGASALLVWSLLAGRDTASSEPSAAPETPRDVVDAGARDRIDALEGEVRRLQDELLRLRSRAADGPTREPAAGPETMDRAVPAERDPRWYLDRYVASFEGGGGGSEYFRLAVDAYARDLVPEMSSLVAETFRPVELRANLVAMLGTPRFRGDRSAIGPLVMLVGCEFDVADAAVRALLVIGDPQCGRSLELLVCGLRSPDLRKSASTAAVRLEQPGSDLVIQRLLACARDEGEARHLLSLADGTEPDAVVELFRSASGMDRSVRLPAADRIGDFRTAAVRELALAWLATEPDVEVRRRLERAIAKQRAKPSWCAEQAAGPPDADLASDDVRSWASAAPNAGVEWLELAYPPLRASGLRVFQGLAGGAIAEIRVRDASGTWSVVWSGVQASPSIGEARFDFATTSQPVSAVRIVLDTRRANGWNEIDAVELLGPDGRSWAVGASASSHYGQ